MTNPTLSSPRYASPESLEFQMHKKQENRKRRNKTQPPSERFFRFNEGTTDYYTIPSETLDTGDSIKLNFTAPNAMVATTEYLTDGTGAAINKGGVRLATAGGLLVESGGQDWASQILLDGVSQPLGGFLYPLDGKIHTLEITSGFDGMNIARLCANEAGASSYTGVMFDVIITRAGAPTRSYAIDDNSDNIEDSIGGFDGTVINGSNPDWSKFFSSGVDWVGEELVTQDVWENPNVIRSEWSFANDQWTLTGGGTSNLLQLVATVVQPPKVILIGNCVSIIGTLSTSASTSLNVVSTTGIYSEIIDTTTFRQLYKRAAGIVNATLDKPSMRAIIQGI